MAGYISNSTQGNTYQAPQQTPYVQPGRSRIGSSTPTSTPPPTVPQLPPALPPINMPAPTTAPQAPWGNQSYTDWNNQQQAAANAPPPPSQSEQDWTQYLTTDPFYQQTTGALSAQGITDATERDRRIAQLMINLGEVPAGYTGPGVTDLVRGLATDNTNAGISTLARLQHAYDIAKRNEVNQQAARGILGSGETGYQLGELGLQNNQSQFDVRNQALDQLAQGNYAFTTSEQQRAMARAQAGFEAAQRASTRGVGPLWEGYGQDAASGFRLNPVGNANNMNQPYQPQVGNTQFAPPGMVSSLVGGQSQYVPDPGLQTGQNGGPFMGQPSYEAWLAAWGG